MDEMFWAATMVAALLICLGILYSPCQAYHKPFHNSFDSARIITLLVFIATGVLFFQMHQMHSGLFFGMGWLPLSFLRGKKLVALGLGGVSVAWGPRATTWSLPSWLLGQPLGSLIKPLPADQPSGRLPSLSVAWEACHKSGLSSTLPLNWGESSQERK